MFTSRRRKYIKTREDIVPKDSALSHADLATACFLHVCDESLLKLDTASPKEPRNIFGSPPIAHLDYCVDYWLEHMRLAERHVEDSIEAEHDFLSQGSALRQAWLDRYWHRKHPQWEKQPSDFEAVHLAAYGGLRWLLIAVLEDRDDDEISRRDSLGHDCLMWAASRGWADVVEHLVSKSAKLDTVNDQMLTAIYLASLSGHAKVVRLLIEAGADVNCCDSRDATLVHCVTMHDHIDILRYLLQSGARVDVRDARNRTAILWACSKGQLAAVKVLKEHGADLQQRDREGMSLLHHAAGHGHMDVATFLLKNDVRIDSKCYGRWTPLYEAAWNGETSVTAFLLRSRPDLSERTGEGHTALHQAAWNGHIESVKLLVSRNAVLDATCYDGETALHQAAWRGHRDVVAALLQAGASPGLRNHDGKTPLDHAHANGAVDVTDLLTTEAMQIAYMNEEQTGSVELASGAHLVPSNKPPRQPAFSAVHCNDRDPPIELDPAIAAVIPGSPVVCDCHHHGHAGFSVPLKVRAQYADGTERFFFCKTYGNEDMFRSEYFSLKSLSTTLPTFCPQPIHVGRMQNTDHYFLLTHFIDAENTDHSDCVGPSLAQKLAALHNEPVPTPPAHVRPAFGFPTGTYCGSTPQDNTFKSSWADFFANQRLGYISRLCEERHGADAELRTWVDRIIDQVVPALLRDGHLGGKAGIVPSLVHGDLWMGNQIKGQVEGWTGIQATTFDPSSVYAHNEYEFAIMRLFGGFLAGFWSQYHAVKPKTEPVKEYEDRVTLYSLYHLLNHYAMDSGGWRDEVIEAMQDLWEKYGEC